MLSEKAYPKTYPMRQQKSHPCLTECPGYKTGMPRTFAVFCLSLGIVGIALPRAHAQAPAAQPAPVQPSEPATGSNAEVWVKFGISHGVAGDLDAAIAAFNEAIKIDPKWAPAYQSRGHARSLQHKLSEAIEDYNQAIAIDPKYQDAFYDRGVAKAQNGDFDGALADFSRTLELDPKYTLAYYNRGHVKYFKGDLEGTLADLNQAILLEPNHNLSYFIRGLTRRAKNDREGAATDFQQSATNGFPDAALWLWIVETKSGEQGVARSDLSNYLGKPQLFKPDSWPLQVGNFLLEKMTQDELLAQAKATGDPDHISEAWFYGGIVKHFAGDTKGAADCFHQAIATGSKISEIYIEAQREAASLPAN